MLCASTEIRECLDAGAIHFGMTDPSEPSWSMNVGTLREKRCVVARLSPALR